MASRTITESELKALRKRESEKLSQSMREDFEAHRVNLSARSLNALYRVLLLDELLEGTFELE